MMRRETRELVRAYYPIPDRQIRCRLFDLAKAIAKARSRSPRSAEQEMG